MKKRSSQKTKTGHEAQVAARAAWNACSTKLSVRISNEAFEALTRLNKLYRRSDCAINRSSTASDYLEEILLSAEDAFDSGQVRPGLRPQRFDSAAGRSHVMERGLALREIDALLDKISAEHDA